MDTNNNNKIFVQNYEKNKCPSSSQTKNVGYEEMKGLLKERSVMDATGALLQRLMFLSKHRHGLPSNEQQPITVVHMRDFLAMYLLAFYRYGLLVLIIFMLELTHTH